MHTIRPPRLHSGSKIALVAPSCAVTQPELDRILICLKSMGLDITVGKSVRACDDFTPGPVELRLADMNWAIQDPAIEGILCATGGTGAIELIEHLDYDAFLHSPKVFVGLSDPDFIVTALQSQTGVITFHGLTGYNFASEELMDNYSRTSFVRTLFDPAPVGPLPAYSNWRVLRPGYASGKLLGGMQFVITELAGTRFEPKWDGSIMLIEPNDLKQLQQLKESRLLDRVSGLVVSCQDEYSHNLILEACSGYDFPILAGVDAGHASPKLTLPIGANAEIDLRGSSSIFSILEPAVE